MSNIRVGVYQGKDGGGDEVKALSSMKINIIRSSRVIGAPVESGQTSFDNKVLDPTKVVVNGVIPISSDGSHSTALSTLKKMWTNRNWDFYYVTNGFDSQGNLILQSMPIIRDVDKFDFINVELTFVEAMMVSKEMQSPSNAENTNVKDGGNQNGILISVR